MNKLCKKKRAEKVKERKKKIGTLGGRKFVANATVPVSVANGKLSARSENPGRYRLKGIK